MHTETNCANCLLYPLITTHCPSCKALVQHHDPYDNSPFCESCLPTVVREMEESMYGGVEEYSFAYALCLDCSEHYDARSSETCPNPACFPGVREYRNAYQTWINKRDTTVYGQQMRSTGATNTNALREIYTRTHPEPNPADFRLPKS